MRILAPVLGLGLFLALCVQADPVVRRRVRDEFHPEPSGPPPKSMKEEDKAYWKADAQARLAKQLEVNKIEKQAKNVIMFLGDGMSISTVTAARIYKGSKTGKWERESMNWDHFPYGALSKTYNTEKQVTDSAASATAYLNGVKTNQGVIGVDVNVDRYNCTAQNVEEFHTDSIAQWFLDAGKAAGFVTTTRITHATPAGTYAHTANRDWEDDSSVIEDGEDPMTCDDIAEQLVYNEPARHFKVLMGGGRRHFLPETELDIEEAEPGYRADGVNLIDEWIAEKESRGAKPAYVWNRDDLMNVDVKEIDYLLGMFSYSHIDYSLQRDTTMDPSLSEMTTKAIEMLRKEEEGYFLLVEGGRIDHAHHDNIPELSLGETLEFDEAVQTALDITDPEETLIVVTADHGHTLTVSGYAPRHTDILDIAQVSSVDHLKYTTLLYGNGPGFDINPDGTRHEPTEEDLANIEYAHSSAVPLDRSTHDGSDVAIYAHGPHCHLFTGIYEENYTPHALAYAACVGNGLTFCDKK